jgi:hypothetical protein
MLCSKFWWLDSFVGKRMRGGRGSHLISRMSADIPNCRKFTGRFDYSRIGCRIPDLEDWWLLLYCCHIKSSR